jgi:ketosteroid isomerase-like protein
MPGSAQGWAIVPLQVCEEALIAVAVFRFAPHYGGRGKLNDLPMAHVKTRAANVFHIRDGLVTRLVTYLEPERVLVDLGLAPEGDAADSPSLSGPVAESAAPGIRQPASTTPTSGRASAPRWSARDTGQSMSQQTVEIVQEVMALVRRAGTGEPEPRLFELLAPDMKLDMSRRTFNPEVYEGHAGLRRFRRERDEVWEEFLVTPERMIDVGDRVVVIEALSGRGRGSGVETTSRSASVWTVQDGQVIHMATYHDPREALDAVGLAE